MRHRTCQELLLDLVYGELAERRAARALAHIAKCESCRSEYERLCATRRAMRSLDRLEPPAAGEQILLAAARLGASERAASRSRFLLPPWAWKVSLTTALVLVVGGVSFQIISLREGKLEMTEENRPPMQAPAAASGRPMPEPPASTPEKAGSPVVTEPAAPPPAAAEAKPRANLRVAKPDLDNESRALSKAPKVGDRKHEMADSIATEGVGSGLGEEKYDKGQKRRERLAQEIRAAEKSAPSHTDSVGVGGISGAPGLGSTRRGADPRSGAGSTIEPAPSPERAAAEPEPLALSAPKALAPAKKGTPRALPEESELESAADEGPSARSSRLSQSALDDSIDQGATRDDGGAPPAAEPRKDKAAAKLARDPKLRAIDDLVGEIERGRLARRLAESVKTFEPCPSSSETERRIYRNSAGLPVKYVRRSESGNTAVTSEFYYDGNAELRLVHVRRAGPGGPMDTRIFFDERGRRLLEEGSSKQVSTGKSGAAAIGQELIHDPEAAFRRRAACQ